MGSTKNTKWEEYTPTSIAPLISNGIYKKINLVITLVMTESYAHGMAFQEKSMSLSLKLLLRFPKLGKMFKLL